MSPETAITPVAPGPLTPRGHLGWSRAEWDVLTDHYPQGGALACAPYLPHRPLNSIRFAAARLGLHYRPYYRRQPPSDDRTDAAIRQLYANGQPPPGAQHALCVRLQRPRQWLRQRAIKLGAIRYIRGRNWTGPEDAILAALEGQGPRAIQKKLIAAGYRDRSEASIGERCRRLGLCAILDRAGTYSANEVGLLLGQNVHVVLRWIKAKRLPAQAQRSQDGGVVAWRVTHQHLREFLIANPLEWTPARVDRFWLIDILAGRVGARSNG
jgi:hypothetical protein